MYGVIVFNKESVVMEDNKDNAKFLIWNEGDFVVVSGFMDPSEAKEWIDDEGFKHAFVTQLWNEDSHIPGYLFDRAERRNHCEKNTQSRF